MIDVGLREREGLADITVSLPQGVVPALHVGRRSAKGRYPFPS
jgi:hypothetical protein